MPTSSSSSKADARIGNQLPRIETGPEYAYSDGDDAATLAAAYGLDPFPWQRHVLDHWLGRTEDGKYASKTCGLAVPRQNGKNALLEIRELYGLCIEGEVILHTAHEVKTCEKAFDRLTRFFEDEERYPELAALLKPRGIKRSNGKYAIRLKNGASIEFNARTRGASRGSTNDVVVIDEAQELTDEQLEAIIQTTKAGPLGNRQVIYTGTPPGPGSPGVVFPRIRENGHGGKSETLTWMEWSVDEIGDVHDVERWYETNPSMGYLIEEQTFSDDLEQMSAEGFAREALGWWTPATQDAVIRPKEWEDCKTDNPPADGLTVYSVKFDPSGEYVAIAVCLKPTDGKPHVELVDYRSMRCGVTRIADWLIERKDRAAQIVIDGKSYTAELAAQLKDGGVPQRAVIECRPADIIESSTRFLSAVREQKVTHYNQETLTKTALNCSKRPIGTNGGWGWRGTTEIDSAPLEAASMAYWGAVTTKRRPGRKVRLL